MSKTYKDICPCKGCKARTQNCHGVCNLYHDWKSNGIEIKREPSWRIYDFSKTKKGGER